MKRALAFTLSVALPLCACSRPDPPVASGIVPNASAVTSPETTALAALAPPRTPAMPTTAACGRAAGPRPSAVPGDWIPWTCWAGCDFWMPPDELRMPPPIEWSACDVRAAMSGCRQMSTPWTAGPAAIAPDVFFSADDGKGRLLVERLALDQANASRRHVEWVVGDVDGALDFALRASWADAPPRCYALNRDLSSSRFALSLHGDGSANGRHVDGLLVGRVGSTMPSLAYQDESPGTNAWAIGARRAVQNDYGQVSAFAEASRVPVYDPAWSPLRTPFDGRARLVGDEIVFQVTDYRASSLWAYDDAHGAHPLVDFGQDQTRGAGNVGTDGRDLVWTQGENRDAGSRGAYADVSIFTAPYTVEPSRLAPRRLRRDRSRGMGTALLQFAVGCGHAGRPLSDGRGVEIVRLTDGAAFVLPGNDEWSWERVLGFTCEEAFLAARLARARYTIARVALSGLGPAATPD